MAHLAFYTSGLLVEDVEHPLIHDFVALMDPIFGQARECPGFLSAANRAGEVHPHHFRSSEDRHAATLTLWQDLASVFAFAYRGLHVGAVRRRQEWFVRSELPNHVAWWVPDGHGPTWAEAVARFECLADEGASPLAFTLRTAFTPGGEPVSNFGKKQNG